MALYFLDLAHKAVIEAVSALPVVVLNGDQRGVRLDNPAGKQSSVAVEIESATPFSKELGSSATRLSLSCWISAVSLKTRNDLAALLFSLLEDSVISIYDGYHTDDGLTWQVDVGAEAQAQMQPVEGSIRFVPMPDFSEDREKFFWQGQVSVEFDWIGPHFIEPR